jgi:CP family cyanate transporter-like MFS transporter
VLLPGIVKKKFPKKFGLVTGIYSSMLGIGAAIAAGISVPLSENAGLGWRWSLGAWALLSFIAFLVWFPQLSENIPAVARRNLRSSIKELGKSRIAWMVAIFVGLQSLTFYTIIAWLPEILQERGMNASTAGWMLAMVQGTGVIGTFVFPAWASNRQRQRLPVVILVLIEMVSLAGLMIPTLFLTPLLVSILGFSLGGSFGMALLFIGMRTRGTDSANELSGMAQSVGYTLAATGPALFGGIYDLSQNWLIPLIFLFLIAFAKLATGWRAGYNEFV